MAYYKNDYEMFAREFNEILITSAKSYFKYDNKDEYNGSLFVTEKAFIFAAQKKAFIYRIPLSDLNIKF